MRTLRLRRLNTLHKITWFISGGAGIQTREKTGYTHFTATVKTAGLNSETTTQTMDSLDPDRPGAEDYTVTKVEPLQLLNLN